MQKSEFHIRSVQKMLWLALQWLVLLPIKQSPPVWLACEAHSLTFHSMQLPTTGVTIAVLLSKWEYLLDRHVWDLPPKMYRPSNVLATITFVLFCLASTLVRVSFLAFYRRLIQHQHRKFYIRVIYATIFFAVGLSIAYIFGLIFRCRFVSSGSKSAASPRLSDIC
jgi:hypothetical protein